MGGSDGNAQQRAVYSYQRRSDRYWWPLFIFLLDVAALKLYLIDDFRTEGKILTRTDFTYHLALSLMKNPAGQTRRHESKIRIQTNSEPLVSTPSTIIFIWRRSGNASPAMSKKQGPPKEKGSLWLKETLKAGKESSEVLKQDGRVEDVIQSDLVVKIRPAGRQYI